MKRQPLDFPAKHQTFVADVIAVKASRLRFTLNPDAWKRCKVAPRLKWKSITFTPDNQSKVPQARGIYAFMIEPPIRNFPRHGYLIYVGITGHDSLTRTLRARYAEYLRRMDEKKRPKMTFLLAYWYEHIRFYFAPVNRTYNLHKLELAYNDAFRPPGVTGDFTAKIRRQQKALA